MIPLFKPFMPTELPELDNILHSGALSYGKWGRLFEEKLGNFIGDNKVVTVNSFNSAILVAMQVIGLKAGDEVIASPMSCLASNQPFATQGVNIIWADIDPTTGTLDPESVKSKISKRTKAIFHNHFCGYLGYINEVNSIGKEKGLYVIDDAIEAFGSEYKGKRIGNTGTDLTIYSFQTVRVPNTIDGGAISFKNNELYKKALLVRDYGINRILFRDSIGEISNACDISVPGYGATLNEINSYIGFQQMEFVEILISKQRKNAEKWKVILAEKYPDSKIIKFEDTNNPNFWVFGLLAKNKKELLLTFRQDGYYSSGVHFKNNLYSVFGKQNELPGVNKFFDQFIAIPCGWWYEL